MRRRLLYLVHFTVCHLDDTVGEVFETHIVSDHDHSDLFSHVEVDQNLHDNISASCVQVTSRLIQKQNFRLICDGASNCDSLLLTTRQLVREVVHAFAETDVLQKLTRTITNFLTRELTLKLHGKLHILESSEGANQVESLEDESKLVETN